MTSLLPMHFRISDGDFEFPSATWEIVNRSHSRFAANVYVDGKRDGGAPRSRAVIFAR